MFGVELFEDVGFEFTVQRDRLDDLFALFVRGRFDEVGDLCGVQPCEFSLRNAHASSRHMGDERLDALPVNDFG